MKTITITGYNRNSLINYVLNDEKEFYKEWDIDSTLKLSNIKIELTGKSRIKEHDDLGPYWEETLYEYEIILTYKIYI